MPVQTPVRSARARWSTVVAFILLLGAGVRAANLFRPVPMEAVSWRESDMAGVARNYVREGMNLFYPRVDWRGDGPGYAEMEFPVYPWLLAWLYKIFGEKDILGRALSYAISIATLGVFARSAFGLLPPFAASIACLFFALSPLPAHVATALQPEGIMLLFYVLAAHSFTRWIDGGSRTQFAVAMAATALALLAKVTAAHLGLFYLCLLVQRRGFGFLRQPSVWLFALGALTPAVLWYLHAHNLWVTYGNSLGVSNEHHWIGWNLIRPYFLREAVALEVVNVWTVAGLAIAAAAVIGNWRSPPLRYCLLWIASIALYYTATLRTTGADWAFYYHVVSVPPAALIIGVGADVMRRHMPGRRTAIAVIGGAAGLGAGWAATSTNWGAGTRLFFFAAALGAGIALAGAFLTELNEQINAGESPRGSSRGTAVSCLVVACLCGASILQLRRIADNKEDGAQFAELRACARLFSPEIPRPALIVASGIGCRDPGGYPVAYNASYMFYWLDLKGFNICQDEQSIAALRNLANRGAGYFIAEKTAVAAKVGFEEELRKTFTVVKECRRAILFRL